MFWFDHGPFYPVALRYCEDILGTERRTKRNHFKNEQGQLTIFLGIILIIVMGLLAFIINVGLFVKAKINLQNAVDAAAYSGAATQARQLTNIGYVNWEMRNTYKEWMFKYYVLGHLGLMAPPSGTSPRSGSLHDSNLASPGPAGFLLENPPVATFSSFDKFNIPSLCIHNNTARNICPLYALPGLPRFESLGIAGISEIHEAFVNKLVEEKADNCSARTQLNFITATSWAYSTGIDIPGAPLVAGGRIGAWPQAIELALRMRNLEMIVNRPPVTEGIDMTKAGELANTLPLLGYNERPLKAYYSAFRNLGGGKYKDQGQDELAATFKLYEIAPSPYDIGETNSSTFLIPQDITYPGTGIKVTTKHYLDLRAYTLNYATMFTSFVAQSDDFDANTKADAICGVAKTALPVPGYIMGFEKNPEVLTYYAVKGEAKYIGLFFPFAQQSGITLKAYAAAKPFGGRIGPKLFRFDNGGKAIKAREDGQRRSAPFSSVFNDANLAISTSYVRGDPIPNNRNFWADAVENIGGIPGSGEKTFFTIPNMIYDFETPNQLQAQVTSFDNIQRLQVASSATSLPAEKLGLHDRTQLRLLKANLGPVTGTSIPSTQLEVAFAKARKPTKYDAINYLIPDFDQRPDANAPAIVNPLSINGDIITYRLFAPLLGEGLLFKTPADVEAIIKQYLLNNIDSVNTYMQALHGVATSVKTTASASNPSLGLKAALTIHGGVNNPATDPPPSLTEPDCKLDVASRFWHFFTKDVPVCGIEPLPYMISTYLAKRSDGGNSTNNIYYQTTYHRNPALGPGLYSAYYPGPRQGTDPSNDGTTQHPLRVTSASTSAYSTLRNYYSTKFVELNKLVRAGSNDYEDEPPLREKLSISPNDLMGQVNIKNLIPQSETSEFKILEH